MNAAAENASFELAPEVYAALVDWSRRLEREGPFFRDVFTGADVRTVLDLACGTGHHAAQFASWGLSVTGLDASAEMIRYCREQHGDSEQLQCNSVREAGCCRRLGLWIRTIGCTER